MKREKVETEGDCRSCKTHAEAVESEEKSNPTTYLTEKLLTDTRKLRFALFVGFLFVHRFR